MRRITPLIAVAAAVVLGSCGGDPAVPNVEGQTKDSAILELKNAGYFIEVKGPDHDRLATVVGQDPRAGDELAEDEIVTIILQSP